MTKIVGFLVYPIQRQNQQQSKKVYS